MLAPAPRASRTARLVLLALALGACQAEPPGRPGQGKHDAGAKRPPREPHKGKPAQPSVPAHDPAEVAAGEANGSDVDQGVEGGTKDLIPTSLDPAANREAELEALGYLGVEKMTTRDRDKVGVTRHDPEKSEAQLGLFVPCGPGKRFLQENGGKAYQEARLLDPDGNVVHRWSADFPPNTELTSWSTAKLTPAGELYVIKGYEGVLKLDWDSKVLWGLAGPYHHDLDLDAQGHLWVLTQQKRDFRISGDLVTIWDNGFVQVSPAGKVERTFWLYDTFKDTPFFNERVTTWRKRHLKQVRSRLGGKDLPKDKSIGLLDVFHANTVKVLPRDVPGLGKKGDILTAIRQMDMVAVLDPKTGALKWHYGPGNLDRPHDPSLTDAGKVVVFDNGLRRKITRVFEIDPADTNRGIWEYRGTREDPLASAMQGLAQPLQNGNVLVSSSLQGRGFEVTRKGEIVWEYWNPEIVQQDMRVCLRLRYLEGDLLAATLKRLGPKAPPAPKPAALAKPAVAEKPAAPPPPKP